MPLTCPRLGWTLVGRANGNRSLASDGQLANLTAQGTSPSHALLVGVSGEPNARLAIETSGEACRGLSLSLAPRLFGISDSQHGVPCHGEYPLHQRTL